MIFDKEIISSLQKLITELKKQNDIQENVIKDEVFNILQALPNCTVVYYPIQSEAVEDGCDGCHVERTIKEKKEQLVFINTANTRERQAFSVAHELGHIWSVDRKIKKIFPKIVIDSEEIINRFAAELLMPETIFVKVARDKIAENLAEARRVRLFDMVKIVVFLMQYFFTPYKATVLRLVETGVIKDNAKIELLKYKESDFVKSIIAEEQYTRLGIKSNQKSIANLQENLDEIEKKGLFSKAKVQAIRETFDLATVEMTPDKDSMLSINE